LLKEYYGKKFIKVGEIEAKVGYKMRVSRSLVNDANFFVRKLAIEAEEGDAVIGILEREMATDDRINENMRNYISDKFGNPEWERLVKARWLKKKQIHKDNDFDPEKVAKIHVKEGFNFRSKKQKPDAQPEITPEPIEKHDVPLELQKESIPEVEDPQGILADGDL
jgi:hypothetical protein